MKFYEILFNPFLSLVLPESIKKHKPHKLKGKFARHSECLVLPDLLLIWLEDIQAMKITLVRTVTHSDLF
ncbi:type II toxin-antitoxin system YafQ family toxin [Tangfeifania diversioriginum]|uniref:type II toxin-antitoxin system YafQ family toxin n=1 Tax=Tangfeifania diversioriginum TaxID=1168035 RepID=UPI0015874C01